MKNNAVTKGLSKVIFLQVNLSIFIQEQKNQTY